MSDHGTEIPIEDVIKDPELREWARSRLRFLKDEAGGVITQRLDVLVQKHDGKYSHEFVWVDCGWANRVGQNLESAIAHRRDFEPDEQQGSA